MALEAAHTHLGIPRILRADDVAYSPEETTVMIYLVYFKKLAIQASEFLG